MSGTVSTANFPETRNSATAHDLAANRASNTVIAYTILRLSFGANIMLHGLSRLLNGRAAFLAYLNHYFEHAHLIPASSLPAFGAVLPWVETSLGLLLMLGLFSRFTMIAGALVMLALVIGTNLAQDWVVSGLQLIYCFLYYYLLVHLDENTISVDAMMH
ncbi:MAG TPA: DoxX family membrane protein [Candidatus Acidoferrales bacterium]|nr:DoxX family membrane protein [Candidatus Acidoferrales bacterium]